MFANILTEMFANRGGWHGKGFGTRFRKHVFEPCSSIYFSKMFASMFVHMIVHMFVNTVVNIFWEIFPFTIFMPPGRGHVYTAKWGYICS